MRLMTLAVTKGAQQVVKALLERGETPNSISPSEESPLMFAASNGQLEVMRLLIDAKADIRYSSPKGMDAMRRALAAGQVFAVNLLLDSGIRLDLYKTRAFEGGLIFDAIAGGAVESLEIILAHGFDVNGANSLGDFPLAFALENDAQPKIIELLLAYGANECSVNSKGTTAVEIVRKRNAKAAEWDRPYEGQFKKNCGK